MQALVALESRFDRTPDGRVWSPGWADYDFFRRYLDVFDDVGVIARLRAVDQPPTGARYADGPGVSFASIPHYVGPWQFARSFLDLRRAIRLAVLPSAAVILRVPGPIGTLVERELRPAGRPYAVEVVADPREVFKPGGVPTRLRPFFRWWVPRTLRRQCRHACALSYVTEFALQQRYPPAPGAFVTSYSTVDLPSDAFIDPPQRPRTRNQCWLPPAASSSETGRSDGQAVTPSSLPGQVVFVGSLEQLYKAPDVLIDAVGIAVTRGHDVRLTIVGGGKHRRELEALARDKKIADRVAFTGNLPPGNAVRAELDRADLFVLPSRTEGLPRAMIEAMARGVPCIGTSVGGIPELLSPDELVAPGSARALADKMIELLSDPARRARLAQENVQKARAYHVDALRSRRRAFYEAVRDAAARSWATQAAC